MSGLDRELEQLHRYKDGELAGLDRWRFERRLRGSEALRSELAAIRSVSEKIVQSGIGGSAIESPDLWASIAAALPAIDAQVEDERARGAGRSRASEPVSEERPGLFGWPIPNWLIGSAALAAAVAIAVMLVLPTSTPPMGEAASTRGGLAPVVVASPAGAVRYLDSGGRSVMVIEDPAESMTIVWMMDSV